jgi:hypothetical protein
MGQKTVDLRRCKRIFFTEAEKIDGTAVVAEMADQTIPVKFLNLSEAGIGFQVDRNIYQEISWDQVILLKVEQPGLLAFLDDTQAEVKYVLDYDITQQVTFGCQFIDLPQTALLKIKEMVAARLEKKENIF